MPNRYWTLKHLAELGGKLSTDGKSFTLGGCTYPCTLVNSLNKARIVFNADLMNTQKQQTAPTAQPAPAAQPSMSLYLTADAIPAPLLPLFKESAFVNIGVKRYLRLRAQVHHTGLIIDQIL